VLNKQKANTTAAICNFLVCHLFFRRFGKSKWANLLLKKKKQKATTTAICQFWSVIFFSWYFGKTEWANVLLKKELQLLSANFGLPSACLVMWENQMIQLALYKQTEGNCNCFLLIAGANCGLASAFWWFGKSKWATVLLKKKN
jgi:hypothetical protein